MQLVLFSKDRPLQLHATLASFRLHCAEARSTSIAVLYCASSPEFARGYQQLQQEFGDLHGLAWVEEFAFKQDLLSLLRDSPPAPSRYGRLLSPLLSREGGPRHRYLFFLVDDTLFLRPFSLSRIAAALDEHPAALAFSLRLGRNTTTCYSKSCGQRLPDFRPAGDRQLVFRWVGEEGDFGYPLEVSSSVYRTADVIGLLSLLPYANPNRLEQRLAAVRMLFALRRKDLLCFDRSVAFCAPLNKVQSVLSNRSGEVDGYSSQSLHRLFEQGIRVDVDALSGFEPHSAHQEIELPFTEATLH
jgi:hypothetical protein